MCIIIIRICMSALRHIPIRTGISHARTFPYGWRWMAINPANPPSVEMKSPIGVPSSEAFFLRSHSYGRWVIIPNIHTALFLWQSSKPFEELSRSFFKLQILGGLKHLGFQFENGLRRVQRSEE